MRSKIRDLVKVFVENYRMENGTLTDWDEPLIAFADADDPLFSKLKIEVSDTHILPKDLMEDAETVITYFIPFRKEVVLSNVDGKSSSEEWAVAYIETNRLIVDLNKYLYKELEKLNFKSITLPPTHNFDEKRLISDWSHKHVAYIAGLGKFGLHRMLITEKGCCGRLGSLITDAEIEPTERPAKEFCLYKYDGTCKKCVENCIFEALKVDSFDRYKCYEVCLSNAELYSKLGLASVCGKCACVVPCSFENPVK